jgi:poly(A) polymerase
MDFARRIVAELRSRGHSAYLVGGCVRDLVMGRQPSDFDVATSAPSDEVARIFPVADLVGAHFGVVLVRDGADKVEVATYRSDHGYRDGRHPDSVVFETNPRADVERRDFTINALLLDPESGEVYDFVGGREDIRLGVVRTVGDPRRRFAEDHLRLLRAIRFAARLRFRIDAATLDAIRELAPQVRTVSRERVGAELERILTEGGAELGARLLDLTGLLAQILPEIAPLREPTAQMLGLMARPSLALALAVLLQGAEAPGRAASRLRFSNDVAARVRALASNQPRFTSARRMEPAELRRFIRIHHFNEHLELHRLARVAAGADLDDFNHCREALDRFQRDLWPAPLLTGDDLIAEGLSPGRRFRELLELVETAQLSGGIETRAQALDLVRATEPGRADPSGP